MRYINPVDHTPRKITKADKDFAKRLDSTQIGEICTKLKR